MLGKFAITMRRRLLFAMALLSVPLAGAACGGEKVQTPTSDKNFDDEGDPGHNNDPGTAGKDGGKRDGAADAASVDAGRDANDAANDANANDASADAADDADAANDAAAANDADAAD